MFICTALPLKCYCRQLKSKMLVCNYVCVSKAGVYEFYFIQIMLNVLTYVVLGAFVWFVKIIISINVRVALI